MSIISISFFTPTNLLLWVQGLDYSAADVSAIEDRNALALAIITSEAGTCFIYLFI